MTSSTGTSVPALDGRTTMRSLHLTKYTGPSGYQVSSSIPIPTITSPTDVLIKCHAAAINPGDITLTNGLARLVFPLQFPYKICADVSGVVVAVGKGIDLTTSKIKPGDEVFSFLPMLNSGPGAASEYVVCPITTLGLKPRNITHVEAASLPSGYITAHQMMQRVEATLRSQSGLAEDGLKGKTVFVSAGLSGMGASVVQVAKHVYGASKVVTSVSTSKVGLVDKLFPPGTVDLVYDYQTEDISSREFREKLKSVVGGDGKVDVYFDVIGTSKQAGHLDIIKNGGVILCIITAPRGDEITVLPIPWIVRRIMDAVFYWNRWRIGRYGITWESISGALQGPEELEEIASWVSEGKAKAVIGGTAKLDNLDEVIKLFEIVQSGKGGVGKYVIEIV